MSYSHAEFSGLYSDGNTAAAHEVRVLFRPDGIQITSPAGTVEDMWPYEKLASTMPITDHDAAQIGHQDKESARLYVSDPAFSREVLARAPRLSRRAEHRRVIYPMVGIIVAVVAIGYFLLFVLNLQPARSIANLIPDKTRKLIGENVVTGLSGASPACTDEDADRALKKIVRRISTGLPAGKNMEITVRRLRMVNAFAAPGDKIIVSGELITFANSPEELAAVVAHEIGHGLERHPEAAIVRHLGIASLIMLVTGGGDSTFLQMGNLLLQMKYARDAEREADSHALEILRKAEISHMPMLSFFERMRELYAKRKSNPLTAIPDILSTHPSTSERMDYIGKQKPWPTRPILTDEEWSALRNICK